MGSTGVRKSAFADKDDFINREVLGRWRDWPDHRLVDQAVRGNEVWAKIQDDVKLKRFIVVTVISSHRDEWVYKDMQISSGPYYYKCPMRMLNDQLIEWDRYSLLWLARRTA